MTVDEFAGYVKGARSRHLKRQQQLAVRHELLQDVVRRGAEILKHEFGVDRVWLFGSVLTPSLIHEGSDVDLAVMNLVGRDYWRALAQLLSLDGDVCVDLVLLEETSESLRQRIESEGILL